MYDSPLLQTVLQIMSNISSLIPQSDCIHLAMFRVIQDSFITALVDKFSISQILSMTPLPALLFRCSSVIKYFDLADLCIFFRPTTPVYILSVGFAALTVLSPDFWKAPVDIRGADLSQYISTLLALPSLIPAHMKQHGPQQITVAFPNSLVFK